MHDRDRSADIVHHNFSDLCPAETGAVFFVEIEIAVPEEKEIAALEGGLHGAG